MTRRIKRFTYITARGTTVKSGSPFLLACCDCGLVHKVVLVSEDEKPVGVAMKRDNTATRKRRSATAWVKRAERQLMQYAKRSTSSKKTAHEVLISLGIYTKSGKLSKRYGG
jgi:hypothetical protein